MPNPFGQPGLRKRGATRPLVIEGRATVVRETARPKDPLQEAMARYRAGEIEIDIPERVSQRRPPVEQAYPPRPRSPDEEPDEEPDFEEPVFDDPEAEEPDPDDEEPEPDDEEPDPDDDEPDLDLGDIPGGEAVEKPWRFVHRGIVIRAGELNWEQLETLWNTVQGLHQSSMFFIGDVMLAAEGRFGEEMAQLAIDYRPETIRNALWVAKSIPIPRRRSLPFSYHQAVASLEPQEQDELLDLVEEKRRLHEDFHTVDLKNLIRERKQARRSNSGPGVIFPNDDSDPTRGGQQGGAEDAERGFGTYNPAGEPGDDIEDEDGIDAPEELADLEPDEVEELRGLLVEVRAAGVLVGTRQHDAFKIRELADRVLDAVGARRGGFNLLMDALLAEQMVPADWYLRITAGERESGRRTWKVQLLQDGRMCAATGPWLPCALVEAALSALISSATRQS
jgi:hypothetical protein